MPIPSQWPAELEPGSNHLLLHPGGATINAMWNGSMWNTGTQGMWLQAELLASGVEYLAPLLSRDGQAEEFARRAMLATGGRGPVTTDAELTEAKNRKMLVLDMVDRVGRPAGRCALPENVAAGAALVSQWLQQQPPGTILHGLELWTPAARRVVP